MSNKFVSLSPWWLSCAIVVLLLYMLQPGLAAASTKSPTVQPTNSLDDPKVGTANAPTTPGGLCLDPDGDYKKWTGIVQGTDQTGFDFFPHDLQECSLACATLLTINQSPEYGCGSVGNACEPDLFRRCAKDCMGNTLPPAKSPPPLKVTDYSSPCASCMGNLSFCGATRCTIPCIQGSFQKRECVECNIENCNDEFMICSGLNPTLRFSDGPDLTPILIGAIVGGLGLLALVTVVGTWYRMRTRKNKMFTPEELAILASPQGGKSSPIMSMSGSLAPIGSGSFKIDNVSIGPHTSNPGFNAQAVVSGSSYSSGSGPSNIEMTPYQQQYLAQQEALAKGNLDLIRQSRMVPSQRVSAMAAAAIAAPPKSIAAKATRLVVIYDFLAERDDELTAVVGAKMFGIDQQEGWWLAQDEKGVVGLIPVSYTEADTDPPPSTTMDPNF